MRFGSFACVVIYLMKNGSMSCQSNCSAPVGSILREAKYAQSKKDFVSKNSMALKEASETQYWLELLHKAEVLNEMEYDSIYADACELTKLLTSIVKTAKAGSLD